MKDFLLRASRRLSILIVSICLLNAHSAKAGGMSGTYTIGSSGTYSSFSAAVSALGTNGVSGAVTFKVAAGTYSEQVSIGKITGVSATNTITFVGQTDSSQVILTSASSSSTNYTLELNQARYVTIKNISIFRTGTGSNNVCVALTSNTYTCTFKGDLISGVVNPNTSGSVTTGQGTINSTGADSFITINDCRIKNGMNCIAMNGTAYGYDNSVTNNILDTAGQAGIYMSNYEINLVVQGNIFNMGAFGSSVSQQLSYGMRLEYPTSFKILKNKFYSTAKAATCRCINIVYCQNTSSSTRSLIANNFISISAGSSASTAIALYTGSYTDIVYNNILVTSVPSNSACIFWNTSYTSTSVVIEDNCLINKGSGYCIDAEFTGSGITTMDYNDLSSAGTYIGNFGSSTGKSTTLSNWQSNTSFDAHSISADPGFVSNTNLHESSAAVYQAGVAFSGISDDIDGDARPSVPCIGADEFVPVFYDAGVTGLDSPATFCYPATKNIYVHFSNFGAKTLTALTINWSVNGTTQTSYSWTGSVANGGVSSPIKIGSYSFSSKNPYAIKIWTSSPDGNSDQNNSNDTLSKSIAAGMTGTYYLGGSSPDFATFNNVMDAITQRGICGPTTIRVRNGVYAEKITIPLYPTSSASNTITFVSDAGDSSKVVLTLPAPGSTGLNNDVIQFNGAKYFTFKNITISKTTGTGSFAQVIEFTNGATNNTIQGCRIIGTQGSNSTGDLIYSDSTSTTAATSNSIIGNAFKYGNFAINLVAQQVSRGSGTVISGNYIDSAYGPAITLSNEDAAKVSGNFITNLLNTSSNAIQMTHCNNAIKVIKNRIRMVNGAANGIYLQYCNGTSSAAGSISNNYVSIHSTGSPAGIRDSSSAYQNIYYNTIDLNGANTGACIYAKAASGNININDNMLYNANGYTVRLNDTTSLASSDYNNHYTKGTNLGLWGAKKATSLTAWQTLSKMDAHSVSIDPKFFSDTSYHSLNPNLYGLGDTISGITTDIENNLRDAAHPSIGAVVIPFYSAANDAGISSIINPANGASLCPGKYPVTVTLKNFGSAILDSAIINWTINGNAQKSYTYRGAIAPNTAATLTIDTFNFHTGTKALKIWSTLPNGIQDSTAKNDTSNNSFTINPSPTASIIHDSAVCSGNATSLGGSSTTGSTYSWTSKPAGFTSSLSNPTINPTSAAEYYQTEVNTYGCVKSDSVAITIRGLNPSSPSAGNSAKVCAGNSIQVGAASSAGLSYSWTSNPSGFSSTSSNPYVTPSTTTTYSVVAISNANQCASLPSTVTITVNPIPAAAAGSSVAVCAGNSATIGSSAVSGDNYSWTSIPSGYSSNASTGSVTPSASTVYYVTETNPATGCSNTNSVLITVNPLPAAFTGSSASLCSGSPTTTIGGTSVKGSSYSWSPNTYLSSGTVSNPTVTLGATTTYTLTETITATGCSRARNITLTLNTSPAANTGVSQAVCAGNSASLGTSAVSGDTYSWSPSSGLSSPTVSNPTAKPASTTNYALTETVTSTGCATTNYVTVTVNPLPAAYVGAVSATSVCTGQSYSLGGPSISTSIYSWTSSPSGFTSSISNPTVTPSAQTTYTLQETNAVNGCVASNSVSVGLIALPVSNISTAAICAGSNGVVVANNTLSTESFKWYYNGNVISGQTGFRVITANGGAYQVNITDAATGCSNLSNVATLVVNPLPSTELKMLQATTQCDGDSVVMIAPLVSDYIYQWSRNGDTISGAHSYIYAAKTSGIYQLNVTSATTKCSDTSVSVPVTINPVPLVPFNVPGKTTICDGLGVLMNTSQQAGVTYSWMKNGAAIAGTDSNYYSATSTGTYGAKLTFDATGCSSTTSTVNVTVNALPQTNVSALGNKNLCPGESVLLVSDPNPSYTYRWENATGYIAGATSDTFTVSQAGNYQVTVTNNLSCSATSSPVSVTAALHPSVTINRPSATTFCQNTIILSATDTEAASIQWWKDGAAIPGATTDSLTVSQTGFYTVLVKGTVTCTAMDTIGITENPVPNAMFSASNDTVCFGNGFNFINQSSIASGNLSYTWSFGDGDSSRDANPAYSYAKSGNYNITLNASASTGCNASASATVTVLPVTKSDFNVTPEGSRRLGFKAVDTAGATYVWNYGDSTFSTGFNGYHEYNRDGKYNITLTAINASGCVTSTTTSELVILSGFGQMSSNNISINVFPNPFKTQTNVQYNLNEGSMVQVDVFDINGRVVAHVDNGMQSAGQHNFVFNGPNPGIYFVKMIVGGQLFVNKIVQQ